MLCLVTRFVFASSFGLFYCASKRLVPTTLNLTEQDMFLDVYTHLYQPVENSDNNRTPSSPPSITDFSVYVDMMAQLRKPQFGTALKLLSIVDDFIRVLSSYQRMRNSNDPENHSDENGNDYNTPPDWSPSLEQLLAFKKRLQTIQDIGSDPVLLSSTTPSSSSSQKVPTTTKPTRARNVKQRGE